MTHCYDHQGSISKIINGDGSVYVSENFTAFGDRRNPVTWSGAPASTDLNNINAVTRDGYTGQTALGSMGLNHMNGRVEDAISGRFLSADPHITDPTNPQNYTRYSYALNNPMSYTDPTGFDQTFSPGCSNSIDECTITITPNSGPPDNHPHNDNNSGVINFTPSTDWAGAFDSPGPIDIPALEIHIQNESSDCSGGEGEGSEDSTKQNLDNANQALTGAGGGAGYLSKQDAHSLGRSLSGGSPEAGNAQYSWSTTDKFGEQVKAAGEGVETGAKWFGRGVGVGSAIYSGIQGYRQGGATQAALNAGYGLADMYVEDTLAAAGLPGALVAIVYDRAGGSKAIAHGLQAMTCMMASMPGSADALMSMPN